MHKDATKKAAEAKKAAVAAKKAAAAADERKGKSKATRPNHARTPKTKGKSGNQETPPNNLKEWLAQKKRVHSNAWHPARKKAMTEGKSAEVVKAPDEACASALWNDA